MESTTKKSLVGVRQISFTELRDGICGYSTWSYVTSTRRCCYDDGQEFKKQCVYGNCPIWKKLRKIDV